MGGGNDHEQWLNWRRLRALTAVSMLVLGLIGTIHRARWDETGTTIAGPAAQAGGGGVEGLVPADVAGAVEVSPAAMVPADVAGAVEVSPAAMVPASIDHLAVVRVSVTRCGERAFGSGVLIDNGLVVTAGHVVGDAGLVRLDQGQVTVTGEVLGVLADGRDLALIEVDGPLDRPVPSAPVPRTGSPVTVVGHPGGNGITKVVGERVDLAASVASIARGPAFGVAVATEVGMSGGPALDEAGRLVGVVIGSETGTGTAIVAAVADAGALAEEAIVDGRCPITA